MLKDKYIFPAVFSFYDNGTIGITFPDLPGCVSSVDSNNIEDALHSAQEALELHMYGMEYDKENIPPSSNPLALKQELDSNQVITFIQAFMPRVRDAINNKAINKMCTVPQWLLIAGKEADINFSQTLQDALIEKLGINREIKHRQYKAKQTA